MKFSLQDAKIIANHYQFLVGEVLEKSTNTKIRAVLVAPAYSSENNFLSLFLEEYLRANSNEQALLKSGFNPDEIEIMILGTNVGHVVTPTKDLDKYLTDHNIEKIYPIQ